MRSDASPLTDAQFWDRFWGDTTLPALVDPQVQWQLALTRELRRHLPQGHTIRLFEVGCAPGRWLIWFSQELGYQVAGCDSSLRGVQLSRENLRLSNVNGEVYQADILTDSLPDHAYDIVVSIGVIEHFENASIIVGRHLDLLKPGGCLIIEVPNMAGRLNLQLLRMVGMHDLLAAHNLAVMSRAYFQAIAQQFGLQVKTIDYIGGFDPGIVVYNYPYHLRELWGRKHFVFPGLVLLERLWRVSPGLFSRLNAPFCSHMLWGMFFKSKS